jgi:putative transposase
MAKDAIASPTSAATLRRALEDWRSKHYDRWVFCREGEKALNDKVLPYIERDTEQLSVGDVLVVDGHTLNFQVVNPYTGKPGRATLLMFFDWASRYPAGWYIMMTENIQCVHAALRRAIIDLGKIPSFCYLDNGRAFRSKYFNGVKDFKECGFEGLYGRLGIKATFAKPYNAQSKTIERFFGSFAELERLMPSYSGNSIENKPAHMMRNERLHKSLHSNYIPSIQQADLLVQTWLEQEYGMRPHNGLNRRTPLEVWNEGKGPGVDEGLLWALLLSQEIKRVTRQGVTFLGMHFYDEALYGLKDRVMIRYDILDLSQILIFSPDGAEYICAARPVVKIHPLAALSGNLLDYKAVQDANKEKARLKKSTVRDYRALAAETNWEFPGEEKEPPRQLTRPEAEDIEAAAAACQVIDLTPALPEGRPLFADETERYEWCARQQAAGQAVAHEDFVFMAEFEQGDQYLQLQEYFDRIRQAL